VDAVQDELGVEVGDTTDDGIFTLFTVACLGCCSLSPVMMIDEQTYGRLTPAQARRILRDIRRKELKKQPETIQVAAEK
jgi:NADH-quinone oxidoreductase subunit E